MGRVENDGVIAVAAARIQAHASLLDGETIILGSKTYEFNDTEGDIVAGRVWLNRSAGSNALVAAEIVAKIMANPPSIPVTAYIDPIDSTVVRIEADAEGERGNMAFETTMANPANVIAASVDDEMSHGANAENKHDRRGSYLVTAIDVAAGSFAIPTGLQAPTCKQLECWSATGLKKNLTTLCTFDVDGRILGNYDGATNPAEGDTINWMAW